MDPTQIGKMDSSFAAESQQRRERASYPISSVSGKINRSSGIHLRSVAALFRTKGHPMLVDLSPPRSLRPILAAGLIGFLTGMPGQAAAPTGPKEILPAGAQLEALWNDGHFTEGAAAGPDGAIYFSDIGGPSRGRIMRFEPASGKTTVFVDGSGQSNGLMFDRDGRLIACCGADGGRRALCAVDAEGNLTELAAAFEGRRFNAPNDLVIHPDGAIYFTDPRYGGPEPRELDHMSVYRFDPRSRSVARVTTTISKPNGVVLSPDLKTLYVAETDNELGRMTLNAFAIQRDGSLADQRQLVDFGKFTGVDGMTVDQAGRVYAAVRHEQRYGIAVYDSSGAELAFIPTPDLPTNCCFGGGGPNDSPAAVEQATRTLYVTSGRGLSRIELSTSGFHPAIAPKSPDDSQ